MYAQIICTIVTACGTVLSAIIAWAVAKHTANKEIEKLKATWEHDDTVSFRNRLSAMAEETAMYVARIAEGLSATNVTASAKISALRPLASGTLADALDQLALDIQDGTIHDIKQSLDAVIHQAREQDAGQKRKG